MAVGKVVSVIVIVVSVSGAARRDQANRSSTPYGEDGRGQETIVKMAVRRRS